MVSVVAAWPTVALGEVAVPVERPETPLAGKTYRQVGVKLWGQGAYEREPVDGGATQYRTLSRVEADDIIVNKIWARNGSVSVVTPELSGCYVSGEFPTFAPVRDRLLPAWFKWLTKTSPFWDQCDEQSRGTSGKNRIRPEKFLQIAIPLPPLVEQRRIVARIAALAARIERARGLRREAMAEAGALWISQQRRVFEPLSEDGWQQLTVENCCEAIIDYRGRTPPIASGGVPHITSANVRDGRIDWHTAKFVTEETYEQYMTRGLPQAGDVIFTMEAPLGEAAVIRDECKFSLAQRTLLLRGTPGTIEGEFLARVLTCPAVKERIYAQATGTTVKGIASKRLKHIILPVPPITEQRRIVAYLDGVQARVDALKQLQAETAAELDALLPAVLDQAFRGEL